jgi:hypothetical protein
MKGATSLLANHIDRLATLVIDLGHHILGGTGGPVGDREDNGLGGGVSGHLLLLIDYCIIYAVFSKSIFQNNLLHNTILIVFLIDFINTNTNTNTILVSNIKVFRISRTSIVYEDRTNHIRMD